MTAEAAGGARKTDFCVPREKKQTNFRFIINSAIIMTNKAKLKITIRVNMVKARKAWSTCFLGSAQGSTVPFPQGLTKWTGIFKGLAIKSFRKTLMRSSQKLLRGF